jgi:hypothetical protein
LDFPITWTFMGRIARVNSRIPGIYETLALSNAYQLEAMINVLERKGILTGKEVLDELKVIAATKGEERGLIEGRSLRPWGGGSPPQGL